jgi:type I site-specific restriction-modification system R (restriction) subunit
MLLVKFVQKKVNEEDIKLLLKQNYIREVGDKYVLTARGKEVLNELIEEDIESNIQKYRFLFKGLKAKSIGDKNNVRKNLKWFIENNKYQYTMEDIIKAAELYIKQKGFFNNALTMRQADYFIKKQINQNGELIITSDLLSVIEGGLEEPAGNWTDTII